MTPERLREIDAAMQGVILVASDPREALRTWRAETSRFAGYTAELLATLHETLAAVARIDLTYNHEAQEYECPACGAFVSNDVGSGRKPHGMSLHDWADYRMKHESDCIIMQARTLRENDAKE